MYTHAIVFFFQKVDKNNVTFTFRSHAKLTLCLWITWNVNMMLKKRKQVASVTITMGLILQVADVLVSI